MVQKVCILVCVCVVVMASTVSGQRPFYAPNPWYDRFGQQEQYEASLAGGGSVSTSTTTTRRPTPTRAPASSSSGGGGGSFNGLADRFLTPVEGSVSFRFYNNVPIQGPETPCIGCTYTLTQNGFVRRF